MKTYDVIPLGERQVLLHFWPITDFLEQFEPGQYYAITCEIAFSGGHRSQHDCIVRRESRRNFANVLVDSAYVFVKSGLVAEAFRSATYDMTGTGRVISEADAVAWRSDPSSQSPDFASKNEEACE